MEESSCTEDDETTEDEAENGGGDGAANGKAVNITDEEAAKVANKSEEALEDLFKAAAKDKSAVKAVPTVPKQLPKKDQSAPARLSSPVKSSSVHVQPEVGEESSASDDEDGFVKGRKKGKLSADGKQAKGGHKVSLVLDIFNPLLRPFVNELFFSGQVMKVSLRKRKTNSSGTTAASSNALKKTKKEDQKPTIKLSLVGGVQGSSAGAVAAGDSGGKSLMELLELEMRARAIKALLNKSGSNEEGAEKKEETKDESAVRMKEEGECESWTT